MKKISHRAGAPAIAGDSSVVLTRRGTRHPARSGRQLDLLDLLSEIESVRTPALVRPPAIYRFRGHTLADYEDVAEQWRKDDPRNGFGLWPISHGWCSYMHRRLTHRQPLDRCDPLLLSADLRCPYDAGHHRQQCECVGGLVYKTICEHCGWHSEESAHESRAVLDGLDHAFPGWRESPVAPAPTYESTVRKKTWAKKVRQLYGERAAGWPVITDRHKGEDRVVAGRSPWDGYDVAAVSLDEYPPRIDRM